MADDQHTRRDANQLIGYGVGIGAFGAASALLLGAVCPVCVVAAPALIGAGVYKRAACYLAERRRAAPPQEPPEDREACA